MSRTVVGFTTGLNVSAIVNTRELMKTLGDKRSLVLSNRVIRIAFDSENPFATN